MVVYGIIHREEREREREGERETDGEREGERQTDGESESESMLLIRCSRAGVVCVCSWVTVSAPGV